MQHISKLVVISLINKSYITHSYIKICITLITNLALICSRKLHHIYQILYGQKSIESKKKFERGLDQEWILLTIQRHLI